MGEVMAKSSVNRKLAVINRLQVARNFLLGSPSNLALEEDSMRLGIVEEQPQAIDVRHPLYRIRANANASGLSEPERGQLRHRLVVEGARG